jgi:hypothetical protein
MYKECDRVDSIPISDKSNEFSHIRLHHTCNPSHDSQQSRKTPTRPIHPTPRPQVPPRAAPTSPHQHRDLCDVRGSNQRLLLWAERMERECQIVSLGAGSDTRFWRTVARFDEVSLSIFFGPGVGGSFGEAFECVCRA